MIGRALFHRPTRPGHAPSLPLLHVFVGASAAILLAAGLFLGAILTRALRAQAVADAKTSVTQYTDTSLGRQLVKNDRVVVATEVPGTVERDLRARPDILSVKVWRRDGVLAWTNLGKERIGRRFAIDEHLREALETGRTEAELEHLGPSPEHTLEARISHGRVLEVYAPLRTAGGRTVGAYEIYVNASPLEASIAGRKHVLWLAVAIVF